MSAVLAVLLAGLWVDSAIQEDERVIFFPTSGKLSADGGAWVIPVHGWIFEPEEGSLARAELLRIFGSAIGFDEDEAEQSAFRKRAGYFLADNERGKRLSVRVGERDYPCEESGADGHFKATLRVPRGDVESLLGRKDVRAACIRFRAVTRDRDPREMGGEAHLLEESGLSVISDIDDTIKVSDVRQRKELLANTFLREYRDVAGMAGVYDGWARCGARFHYVSASPWQLYEPIVEFLREKGFPPGTFHMKTLGRKGRMLLDVLEPPGELKRGAIEELIAGFPRRRFYLVGDSGELDPEIYGGIARKHPDGIAGIYIRDVTGEPPAAERYRKAFEGVPAAKWRIFDDPADLPALEP